MVVVWGSDRINVFEKLTWFLLTGQLALGRDWKNRSLGGYYSSPDVRLERRNEMDCYRNISEEKGLDFLTDLI